MAVRLAGDPFTLALGDLDRDGVLDLVVADATSDSVRVLLGQADGTFLATWVGSTGAGPVRAVALGDLNGDGHLDLATLDRADRSVGVLLGRGGASFALPLRLSVPGKPSGLTIGDVDGDGRADLVVTHGSAITVLRRDSL